MSAGWRAGRIRWWTLLTTASLFCSRPVCAGPGECVPLPPSGGGVISVSSVAELQAAVSAVVSGTTILVADGVYDLDATLVFDGVSNVTLRGASGDRDAVVLRGRGMGNPDFGQVPHVILVQGVDTLLLADMTLRDAYFHNIQVQGEHGPRNVRMHNLRLVDSGEQQIKGSTAGPPGPYADDCSVECSLIEYSDRARSWYTNGVDILAGARWLIRDNLFRRIRAPVGELAGPAVLMWRNSLDSVVERNLFIECDRGIALGLSSPDANSRDGESTWDHQGGVVRNNMIYRAAGSLTGDVGISVNYARDVRVLHNTVLLEDSFPWTIEHRFAVTSGLLAYNLTDGSLLGRDGSGASELGNLTGAQASWFADAAGADLHLDPSATAAINQASPLAEVVDDYDLEPRDSTPDIGADELASCVLSPDPVTGLVLSKLGDDIVLGWQPSDPGAYNAWRVRAKSDIDLARVDSSPPAEAVPGCAEPVPSPSESCTDPAAVSSPDSPRYYQVRATCGGLAEGP